MRQNRGYSAGVFERLSSPADISDTERLAEPRFLQCDHFFVAGSTALVCSLRGGEALPARIIYNTNIQSGVCIPLQGMEGKQPGDNVSLSSSFHHRLLEYKDPKANYAAAQFPGCVIESDWE